MSDHNADYLYALELQKKLNGSLDDDIELVDFKPPPPSKKPLQIKRSNPHSNLDEDFLNRTQNLVHPLWETLDPTPDVNSLFNAFDGKFFQQRLKCVTLEWSKRMYSCAGICYSSKNRYGMSITIRLSEPLLKLRPRKDLVETLLHEMIHAYCFVLNIREGNGGHGPNFKKIMHSINQVAGTNITVYHTFQDEVNLYKQHWWRCNGACQNRSPFFGYVKRTSNRAPSANDQWWAAHQESCGGTFLKIKGPEPKKKPTKFIKAKENNPKSVDTPDLRSFFPNVKKDGRPTTSTGPKNTFAKPNNGGFNGAPVKTNGGGTMLLNPKTKAPPTSAISKMFPPSSYPGLSTDPFVSSSKVPAVSSGGGNLRNVKGFGDLSRSTTEDSGGGGSAGRAISSPNANAAAVNMTGQGYSLHSNRSSNVQPQSDNKQADRDFLRNVWSKRFAVSDTSDGNDANDNKCNAKRRRLSSDEVSGDVQLVADNSGGGDGVMKKNDWIVIDEDIMLQERSGDGEVIALSSDDDDDNADSDNEAVEQLVPSFKQRKMTADERQTVIKREILDETCDLLDEDIVLIDDEYDANEENLDLSTANELADTSIIDEFFSDDTLLQDFKRENEVVPSGSRYVHNPQDDIITCPVCQYKMKRSVLSEHLDGCTGIAVKIMPRLPTMKKLATSSREAQPKRAAAKRKSKKDILREAGYSEEDLQSLDLSTSTDEEEYFRDSSLVSASSSSSQTASNQPAMNDDWQIYRQRNIRKTTRQCPACAEEVEEDQITLHLDYCLENRRRSRRP